MYSFIKCIDLLIVALILILQCESPVLCKSSNAVVENILDIKDFKKLLRTKNNVLICYISSARKSGNVVKVFRDAAESVKGQGTMVLVDCSGEAKKLCRKLKVSPEPYVLKHYKDGDFHKDYDRKETVPSMLNFMRDPAGDVPWDEDDSLAGVHHIPDVAALTRLVRRQPLPVMVMFYAPWCGFCKTLKPEYAEAARELQGQAVMAAIDVNRPENAVVRSQFNITGFPTLLYFENGVNKMTYEGDNKKQALVDFMRDPRMPPPKPKEEAWSDGDNDVVHLTDDNMATVLAGEESALVMFYAPWCGHCKRIKPDYESAATKLKEGEGPGILAAIDATKEREAGKRYAVKGYPTIKYFQNGDFQYDVSVRDEAAILNFMRDPKQPPPPPPPEAAWADQPSEVLHLGVEDFKPSLKKRKHALVMFYAPWCGHCKKAKPEFTDAAERLKEDPRVALAAVDCTAHAAVCSTYQVTGYPTLKLFHYLNKQPPEDYSGGRLANDFLRFMAPFTSVDLSDLPAQAAASKPADEWKPEHVAILDPSSFDAVLKAEPSLLVMFYAPWCGHCTQLKGPYADAAKALLKAGVPGKLAAVDASAHSSIGERFSITGFPTLKYFRSGQLISAYGGERSTAALVAFMQNPPTKPVVEKTKDEL